MFRRPLGFGLVVDLIRQSMIRKSGYRFSLATNAKRLRGDHAQTKTWSEMTIRRKVITLEDAARGLRMTPERKLGEAFLLLF
jgi:hypothetical protein